MTAEKTTLTTRVLEQDSYTEWYLTGRPAPGQGTAETARELFEQAADILAKNHVQVLHEKLFGLRTGRAQFLDARRQALTSRGLDAAVPLTFLQGTPTVGGTFSGLQIWGVSPKAKGERMVETIERKGVPVGRRWTGSGFRLTTLSSVDGSGADGKLPDCAPCQAKNMFANASAALAASGHSFKQVVRTWIYFARILDWYGDFNRIRNVHYAAEGLSAAEGSIFPASTGIQAQSGGEECLMDILALDASAGSNLKMKPVVRSARQDKAFSYGSAFSRATALEAHGRTTLYISGTASIDAAGRSRYLEDPEAQTLDTLLCIAALIEDQGGTLENLYQATVYCKNAAVVEAWTNVTRKLRLPALPAVAMIADVCRPELLIEIEAIAVI